MSIAAAPRRFVPKDLDAGDPLALEPLFADLLGRELSNRAAIEAWLLDESELLAVVAAEIARRYIAQTCHTDDPTARDRYLAIERDVTPKVKVWKDALDRLLLASTAVGQLDATRYHVLLRRRRTAVEIFRAENTALETREVELQTRQQALMGSIVVEFRGQEHTLQQMGRYLEEPDRDLREAAFRASLDARRAHWPELESILDQLLQLRGQIARNAGFPHFVPFRFRQLQRFDYGPEHCRQLHTAIERVVVPAVQRANQRRRAALRIARLRPWDLDIDLDCNGQAPLRPFETESQLLDLVQATFARVEPRFAQEFGVLRQHQLLDLMSRKGKAPGGYQYTLEDVRLPFIFANSAGLHRDVQTLLHEGGHAFHALLSRDLPLLDDRDAPIEMAETASMSMELMGLEELAAVYSADNAKRARAKHLEDILRILTWIASIDAFQLWMYENQGHSSQARRDVWLGLRARFAPDLDYEGLEDALAWQWTSQIHLYNHPLYYIEYAIAQLAALQVWQRYRHSKSAAVESYRGGLALGGTRPLPELFAATGVKFDLTEPLLRSLVTEVEAALA